MSDLSRRARKTADEQRNAKWYISGCDELLDDLADEIENLQDRIDALQARATRAETELRDRIPDLERRLEACRRYFEHCARVSLSARHAGCDSIEMRVRLALSREAAEAVREQGK